MDLSPANAAGVADARRASNDIEPRRPEDIVAGVLAATVAPLRRIASDPKVLDEYDRSEQIIHPLDKIAAETVLLLYVVDRHFPALARHSAFAEIAEICTPLVRSERHLFMLRVNPRLCTSFGIGHILLTLIGRPDPRFDAVFALSYADSNFIPANKLPFRLLDDYWLRNAYRPDVDDHLRLRELFAGGIANSRISPLYMNMADFYAFTHEIMYATDFGAQVPGRHVDRARLAERIEIALYDCIWNFDLDLMAEFVACDAMLGTPRGLAARFCAGLLDTLHADLGFLPSRSYDFEAVETCDCPIRREVDGFYHSYHTTHVYAMMTCILAATRPVPQAVDRGSSEPVSPARFDAAPNDQQAQWIPYLEDFAASAAEKQRIVNGVQLNRLARDRRYERLLGEIGRIAGRQEPVVQPLLDECLNILARIGTGNERLDAAG